MPTTSSSTVTDVYGEQIEVGGKWLHAERLFGRPAASYKVGDVVPELAPTTVARKAPEPDEYVTSDLFRESGANVSHTPEKIQEYVDAMVAYGGWGDFPMVAGRIYPVTKEDVERYKACDAQGTASELAYSRPLTKADIGLRIVHLENGHNRAYAAAQLGITIPTYDMELEERQLEESPSDGERP